MSQLNVNERRSVFYLFLYGFGNAAAYVVARTVADSEFLSRVGPEQLPRMYLAAAGVVAFVSTVYGKFAQRSSVRRSVFITLLVLAVTSAALPELIHHFPTSKLAMASVYLLAQVRGTLGTIQFTMLLNEQFAKRRPERVVGVVGIGSTMAGFIGGVALSQSLNVIDVATLMYAVAAIDVLTLIPVNRLRRLPAAGAVADEERSSLEFFWLPHTDESPDTSAGKLPNDLPDKSPLNTPASRYIFLMAAMVAVCVFASTLVEYQWKVAVADDVNRNEQELARYFGRFYGWTYLITGTLQFFVTAQLLKTRGLLAGLMIFPIALLVTGGAVALAATAGTLFWAVTFAKGSDAFKRSFNDPSIHVLYSRMDRFSRHRAVTIIAGIVKPLTEAVTAIVLVVLAPFVTAKSLSIVVMSLVVVWLTLNVMVWKGYREHKAADEQVTSR